MSDFVTATTSFDVIPATFVQTSTATGIFWGEGNSTDYWNNPFVGQYLTYPVVTPTYYTLQVQGPSSLYAQQLANYGAIGVKVTVFNLRPSPGGRYGAEPVYIDVVADGLHYKLRAGIVATVPRNVANILAAVPEYTVVLNP